MLVHDYKISSHLFSLHAFGRYMLDRYPCKFPFRIRIAFRLARLTPASADRANGDL
jgi:hypothetical protein